MRTRTGPVRLDLNKLEVFLEATRCGSYTAAARRLHVTQSAVSHAIRKLEDGVGHDLVEWRQRRLALTDQGEYLRQACQRIFHDLGEVEHVLSARTAGQTQVVTIGATVEFGTTVLVRKLRPLVDAAPWLHPSVQATALFREKYQIVASPSLLASHRIRRPLDLESVPVVSLDKDGAWWANALRALPGDRRPVLGRIVEVNQVRAMVHAALEGYGVALLPKYTVLGKVARGELTALFPRLRLLEDWFCVYQKRAHAALEKNRVVSEFLTHLDVAEFGDAIKRPSAPPSR
jgi:DNA-binding transcriptional LysR family regulator